MSNKFSIKFAHILNCSQELLRYILKNGDVHEIAGGRHHTPGLLPMWRIVMTSCYGLHLRRAPSPFPPCTASVCGSGCFSRERTKSKQPVANHKEKLCVSLSVLWPAGRASAGISSHQSWTWWNVYQNGRPPGFHKMTREPKFAFRKINENTHEKGKIMEIDAGEGKKKRTSEKEAAAESRNSSSAQRPADVQTCRQVDIQTRTSVYV